MEIKNSATPSPVLRVGITIKLAVWASLILLILITIKIFLTPSWEYSIISPNDYILSGELNKSGKDGWEIAFARRATSRYGNGASYEIILKRRRSFLPSNLITSKKDDDLLSRIASNAPVNETSLNTIGYPAPDNPRAKVMLRACIGGKVHSLNPDGRSWGIFTIAGDEIACHVEK